MNWSGWATSQAFTSARPSWKGRSHVHPMCTAPFVWLESPWHIVTHLPPVLALPKGLGHQCTSISMARTSIRSWSVML